MGNAVVTCKPHIRGFIDSMISNPSPDEFHTMQVSSYEDLHRRVESSQEAALKLQERLKTSSGNLMKYKQECDDNL
jgi:hypothetical protein